MMILIWFFYFSWRNPPTTESLQRDAYLLRNTKRMMKMMEGKEKQEGCMQYAFIIFSFHEWYFAERERQTEEGSFRDGKEERMQMMKEADKKKIREEDFSDHHDEHEVTWWVKSASSWEGKRVTEELQYKKTKKSLSVEVKGNKKKSTQETKRGIEVSKWQKLRQELKEEKRCDDCLIRDHHQHHRHHQWLKKYKNVTSSKNISILIFFLFLVVWLHPVMLIF